MIKLKRTFAEKVGTDIAFRLIELFIEEKTFGEIITELPEADLTIGKIAGLRRDHKEEIETLETAYRVRFPFGRPERLKVLLARALAASKHEESSALAKDPKPTMKRKIAQNLVDGKSWEEMSRRHSMKMGDLGELMRRHGGIAEYLMWAGYVPKVAKLVEKLRKADALLE